MPQEVDRMTRVERRNHRRVMQDRGKAKHGDHRKPQ